VPQLSEINIDTSTVIRRGADRVQKRVLSLQDRQCQHGYRSAELFFGGCLQPDKKKVPKKLDLGCQEDDPLAVVINLLSDFF
jgi:hypothetical protein